MLCRREVRSSSVSSSSLSAEAGTVKLDPCPADAPCRRSGPAISKCDALRAHRSSTCAGPFDAVIDVVRNRRLMRGARLLLLPALGFLSALFRCLRHLPSLLRHAALLAVSEWRCRPCPRGSRTLHWDYYSVIKKPVFLQRQARSHLRRHHGARPRQRAQNARHVAQHDCATPRTRFFRALENAHKIWLSGAFDFLRNCRGRARRVTRARSPNRPQRCVKHTKQLVQKNFCTEALKPASKRRIWQESSESARE